MRWQTKKGEIISLSEMSNNHIHNCISQLKQKKLNAILKEEKPALFNAWTDMIYKFEVELSTRKPFDTIENEVVPIPNLFGENNETCNKKIND